LICPIFGVIAWNMGNRDLELMAAGQMDASGMRMTQLGRMLGLIHVLSLVALTILGLSFAVIFLVMR
jgi:formate hydrogenlyase subunit 4